MEILIGIVCLALGAGGATVAMRSAKQGDTLYIKPKTAFRYAAVFYEAS